MILTDFDHFHAKRHIFVIFIYSSSEFSNKKAMLDFLHYFLYFNYGLTVILKVYSYSWRSVDPILRLMAFLWNISYLN